MSNIRVFERGDFFDEINGKDIPEREFQDTGGSFVIQDRYGSVGIVEMICGEYHIQWIDGDDRFRIERIENKNE